MDNATEAYELNLLTIPDVVHDQLLEYLGPIQQLSLRRVCKTTKSWIETEREPENAGAITKAKKRTSYDRLQIKLIYEGKNKPNPRSIENFLNTSLKKISNFYIHNEITKVEVKDEEKEKQEQLKQEEADEQEKQDEGEQDLGILQNIPKFPEFIAMQGPKIRKLKLSKFTDNNSQPNDWEFFSALNCLEEFEIKEYVLLLKFSKYDSRPVPRNFETLKALKIGTIAVRSFNDTTIPNETEVLFPRNHWIMNIMETCPKIERFNCPQFEYETENLYIEFVTNVTNNLKKIKKTNNRSLPLKSIDLKYFTCESIEDQNVNGFLNLLAACFLKGVKLYNVDMAFLDKSTSVNIRQGISAYGTCILSVHNFCPDVKSFTRAHLPNLEEINVDAVVDFGFAPRSGYPKQKLMKTWPKLRSINLEVSADAGGSVGFPSCELLELLVNTEPRPGVTEFSMKFNKKPSHKSFACSRIVKSVALTANFCNLNTLKIDGWEVHDLAFGFLWRGLPQLQVLIMDNCPSATDLAFTGERREEPPFFKLTRLRKLSLDLESMKGVTDRFFEQILQNVGLKELILKSKTPVEKVTKKGIEELLKGKFAETIEIFPFHTWSSRTILPEEMESLRDKFRSLI